MEKSSTSATSPLDHKKLAQLNLLLDKAKLFSQFIGQNIEQTTENLYDSKAGGSDPNDSTVDSDKKKGKTGSAKSQPSQAKSMAQALSAFDNRSLEKKKRLAQPPLVTGGQLRSYQEEGLNWLIQLYENGLNGILADEMGLGKTVMTISFLAHLWWKGVAGPFLIVSPSSTLDNWVNEFNFWAPTLPVVKYHGTKVERLDMQRELLEIQLSIKKRRKVAEPEESSSSSAKPVRLPTIITSYEIAIRDRSFLEKFNWKYLVVDEAHRLKNFNSRLIRELRALRTENRLLLTGTPLQNNLSELWSLLNFVLPEVFDNLDNFQSWFDFDEVIDSTENRREMEEKLATSLVEKLHTILQPFLLRRLKSDLPDLKIPPKRQIVIYVPFSEPQRVFYDLIKLRDFHSLIAKGHKIRVMNILMQLRKVCNHPFLFDEIFDTFYNEWKKKPEEEKAPLTPAKKAGTSSSTKRKSAKKSAAAESMDSMQVDQSHGTTKRYAKRASATRVSYADDDVDRFGLSDSDEEEIVRYSDKKKPKMPVPTASSSSSATTTPSKSPGKKSATPKKTASRASTPKSKAAAKATASPSSAKKRKRGAKDDDEESEEEEVIQVEAASDVESDEEYVDDEDELSDHERNERLLAIARSQPIRRSQSAFMLFCAEKRSELATAGETFSMDLQREWAAEWRQLSGEDKKIFEEQAAEDRMRYLRAIEDKYKEYQPNIMIDDPKEYVKSMVNCSGKLQLLDRMLPELRKRGHKVLIFSQFTRMLDILEDYLEYSGYTYCRLDGSVAQKDRQVQIDRYNKDPSIFAFLLSTRAGGLGINLNGADTVIIFDSDWNPQMDLQAQDRCHRIGQTKPVVVFRLITANSVESNILRRATQKLKLERLVIHKDRFKGEQRRLVSEREMLEILNDDAVDGVLGDENTITEQELQKMLDRKVCMELFEEEKMAAATENAPKKSAAANQDIKGEDGATPKLLPPPTHEGYELIEETADGQGLLKV